MVVDRLAHWQWYRGLPERWVHALRFLSEQDLAALALGRHDLDGDRLFALVQEYPTRAEHECRWEAHRRYCDVQYVAAGCERIGVAALERMTEVTPYDAAKDVAFFEGPGDWLTMPAGTFAIFTPHDVHRPCVALDAPQSVRKIVIKALLESERA